MLTGDASKIICKIEGAVTDNAATKVLIRILIALKEERISSVFTRPIHLVKYKLWIDPHEWDDVWYRDEGGIDSCVVAQVQLRQADGSISLGNLVSFHLAIHYDDADSTIVTDQSILNVTGGCNQTINPETGSTLIKFRIEELSKHHQGLDFKLLIAADSTRYDIAPVYSPEFTVRSQPYKQRRLNLDTRPSTETEEENMESHGTSSRERAQELLIAPPGKEGDVADAPPAALALFNVIDWANRVVDDLYTLKWKVVGYETKPDGNVDYSSPVYDSSNPNEVISNLISK